MTPRLAIFGEAPRFERPVPLGQRFFPAWPQYEAMFRDIFSRQYYTNHGPLAQELERRLAEQLGVRHAMCVTNEFIGLALVAQALDVRGEVLVPGHAHIGTAQTLAWTFAKPVECDVDPETGLMTAELSDAVLRERNDISAILAVNPWGDACDVDGLEELSSRHGIPLYIDSSHAFGCAIGARPVGAFGVAEVISFHSDNIVGACEGGVICTQSDELASRIRNMRSNYGMGPPVPVAKTGNGRLSEAQAAIALFNLEHFVEHRDRNERLFRTFDSALAPIPGIRLRTPCGVTVSNYQNLICSVDEDSFGLSRDELFAVLRAENLLVGRGFAGSADVAFDGSANPQRAPNGYRYSSRTIELPTNHTLSETDAEKVIDVIATARENAATVRSMLGRVA